MSIRKIIIFIPLLEVIALLLFVYFGKIEAPTYFKYIGSLLPLVVVVIVGVFWGGGGSLVQLIKNSILAAVVFVALFQVIGLLFSGLGKDISAFSVENLIRLLLIGTLVSFFHFAVFLIGFVHKKITQNC